MGLLFENTIAEVVCLLIFISWLLYLYVTKQYNYWDKKGVPYIQPKFPFGCQMDLVTGKYQVGELYQTFYKNFKNVPYFGVYETRKPVFVVKDPELIKRILTKDFHHFMNRFELNINEKSQYILRHLFNMTGQDWKKMRLKLAPTFTSGKMKLMFFLMLKCSEQLRDYISKQIQINHVIDVKEVLARFTMDIIATCAFGLEINSLSEKDSEFYKVGRNIFRVGTLSFVKRFIVAILPFMNKVFASRIVSPYINKFLTKTVQDTLKYREVNNIKRDDFLDMLIKVRHSKKLLDEKELSNSNLEEEHKNKQNESGLSIEEITAQCFIFFAAGFETASSTMTFCLFELSQNPDIQEALYQEVRKVLAEYGDIPTYQALQEMTYMDQVINETLRLYASLPSLDRTCTETYKLPDSDLVLKKGQRITIPTYAIHHDPDYYPDPYKFDPERFSPERVKERHPYVHLPFGEGPRMCIGMRFGLMQTKIGLTEMISKFKFSLSPATHIPMSLNKRSFITQPSQPVLLHISDRKEDCPW